MTDSQLFTRIATNLKLKLSQVENTVTLLDTDNTVPFIARYRKERTGELNEIQIRDIQKQVDYLRTLESRKEKIRQQIEKQGKLTPELKAKIDAAQQLQELEDLYLPYRPKKRTRATIARERGLEPLAQLILDQEIETGNPANIANKYVDPAKEVATPDEALQGAMDIVAEHISENAEIRKKIRDNSVHNGFLQVKARDNDSHSVYEMYYDYSEPVVKIPSHRILAINRGENEKILSAKIDVPQVPILEMIREVYSTNPNSIFHDYLIQSIEDGYQRLIAPAIERDIRRSLTEKAEEKAIAVFARNLHNLLLQPPIPEKTILGIDPGYRTGCKVAVIDKIGRYITGDTIYPHPPQNDMATARKILIRLIKTHRVEIIAIGNGTASRETEALVADLIRTTDFDPQLGYTIVNEAGASV